ncbi:membrane bound O-acyl transferase family-domain-containing protein [Rhodocollybia butyracea]|uniref:Membrane bound O-acyl transferase family-domain-containing protein n=1 Tax=Rhodocollybia butyracea TaxID=206335 RepID=A0A9P5PPT3_9AGAR|nr:membrane bound O-acyl transferase family-domain-containing protein [Rhodocollybia butyracea]
MTAIALKSTLWSLSIKPFKRKGGTNLLLNASDLALGLRGIGWNWSQVHLAPETRPTSSKTTFVLWTLASLCLHIPVFDALHYAVQSFGPTTFGTINGGSIFDDTLSPLLRYSRSTFISFLSGLVIYCAIRITYDVATVFGIVVLRQHPTQWPPIFNSPWRATSLSQFWSKRWHQLFRDFFVGVGGVPMTYMFGRIGGVLGTFFISGLLHDVGLWGMGKGSDAVCMIGFFIMMGFGVILEGFWRKVTGHRVDGWIGWIWMCTWLLGWLNLLVNAWAAKGLIGSLFIPDAQRLPVKIFGPLS